MPLSLSNLKKCVANLHATAPLPGISPTTTSYPGSKTGFPFSIYPVARSVNTIRYLPVYFPSAISYTSLDLPRYTSFSFVMVLLAPPDVYSRPGARDLALRALFEEYQSYPAAFRNSRLIRAEATKMYQIKKQRRASRARPNRNGLTPFESPGILFRVLFPRIQPGPELRRLLRVGVYDVVALAGIGLEVVE